MRRHRLDPFSLVFGAVFLFVGMLFLLERVDGTTLNLRWLWPLPLIMLGALIIATAVRGDRRTAADPSVDDRDPGMD